MFTILGILGVVVSQPSKLESKLPPPVRDEKFVIRTGPAPTGFDGFETWMAKAARDRDGTIKASGVLAVRPRDPRFGDDHYIQYPPLSKGDIVPLFGILRRVESISRSKKGGILLKRVKEDEISENCNVRLDSVIIMRSNPESNVHTRLHNHDVQLIRIRSSDGDQANPVADVRIRLRNPDKTVKDSVRRGELLRIGTVQHRVRNVVPADKEKGVVGWLELAPEAEEG